jgi:hypothetical protein
MSEWVGKLHGTVARLAGLLHLAEHLHDGFAMSVSADTMLRAIAVGRYLLDHAQAVHDLMGADDDLDRARFVLQWLPEWIATRDREKEPLLTRRGLMTHTSRSRFPDAASAEETLARLADFGWLRPVDPPKTRGRPVAGVAYEVHPQILATQATKATQVEGAGQSCVVSAAYAAENPTTARSLSVVRDPDDSPRPSDEDTARWSSSSDREVLEDEPSVASPTQLSAPALDRSRSALPGRSVNGHVAVAIEGTGVRSDGVMPPEPPLSPNAALADLRDRHKWCPTCRGTGEANGAPCRAPVNADR